MAVAGQILPVEFIRCFDGGVEMAPAIAAGCTLRIEAAEQRL